MSYTRDRSQLETTTTTIPDQVTSSTSIVKRTASFVCLNLNDVPILPNDQLISTISGTLVSQSPLFKTLPNRRFQRPSRQQQQSAPQKARSSNSLEIDKMPHIASPTLAMPNLLELATRTTPLPNLPSSTNNIDPATIESPYKYSYETQTDSNGVNHHRLHSNTDHHLRSHSKNEISPMRTTHGALIKMPIVISGNQKKLSPQKSNSYSTQQPLSTIESLLRERSMTIPNEHAHHSDGMERVNRILKQLYPQTEKK